MRGKAGCVSHRFAPPIFRSDLLMTTTNGAQATPSAECAVGAMVTLARGFLALIRDPEHLEDTSVARQDLGDSHGELLERIADS